jgi:hypothetical protein
MIRVGLRIDSAYRAVVVYPASTIAEAPSVSANHLENA